MHLPPIRQMQYLAALHDTMHFGAAAQQVFVSQSTLSSGIKELESFLDIALVERTSRTVAFTPAGLATVKRCKAILLQAQELVDTARQYKEPLVGPLHLGVIPTIAPYLIPQWVTALRNEYPLLQLYLRESTTAQLIRHLLDGKLDLLVLALPYRESAVQTETVFREPLVLAHHRDNHAVTDAVSCSPVDFNKLPDESLLLLEDGHCLRDHALSGCQLMRTNKVHTFGATSLQMLIQMVNANLGVTLLPQMAVDQGILAATDVVIRPLPERFHRDIGLAWREGAGRTKEIELLADSLRRSHPAD